MRTRLDADFSTRESDVHLVLVRLHVVACKITLFHPGFGGLAYVRLHFSIRISTVEHVDPDPFLCSRWHSARGALQIATANLVWKS